jgi:hypothetical protein
MQRKDEIDELIEEIKIESTEGGEGGVQNQPPEPPENPGNPNPPQPPAPPSTEQKTTPKDVLGIDTEDWDVVKQKLSEIDNLREKVNQAELQPKAVFANEKIAGYNEFIKKYPKIENFSFYERLSELKPEDPIQVLVAEFLLDNPQFIGKEDLVAKKIEKDFKVDASLYTPEEIEFSKIELSSASNKAMEKINGLRESINASPAVNSIDFTKRESDWSTAIQSTLTSFDKLRVPVLNAETQKPEAYIEYEIPKDFKDQYLAAASKQFSRFSEVNEAATNSMKDDLVKTFLFTNFDKIAHAIKTKAAADERAAVEAEFENSGVLRSNGRQASPNGGSTVDDYDKLFQ